METSLINLHLHVKSQTCLCKHCHQNQIHLYLDHFLFTGTYTYCRMSHAFQNL
uniref:Uncharacterized protein n=1 Tax=Anguilla anguilla TaxID=7936 RepID=A0A0E9S493_ANGAN